MNKKSDEMRKSVQLGIRLTRSEEAALKEQAARTGSSPSELTRKALRSLLNNEIIGQARK